MRFTPTVALILGAAIGLIACGGGDDGAISELLAEPGRELPDAEFSRVVDEIAEELDKVRSLRMERIEPDPFEQCDGCFARVDIVRREDGVTLARLLNELPEAGEEERPSFQLACSGGPEAPAYSIRNLRGPESTATGPAWEVTEFRAADINAGLLAVDFRELFPDQDLSRVTALGQEGSLFGMELEDDGQTRLSIDRDGRVRELRVESLGVGIVYRLEYDPDISVELPQLDELPSCPTSSLELRASPTIGTWVHAPAFMAST